MIEQKRKFFFGHVHYTANLFAHNRERSMAPRTEREFAKGRVYLQVPGLEVRTFLSESSWGWVKTPSAEALLALMEAENAPRAIV